jgi:HlyD family secretion protein
MAIRQQQDKTQAQPQQATKQKGFWTQGVTRALQIILLVLALVAVAAGFYFGTRLNAHDNGVIRASGRIEGEESHLGSRLPSQVKAVFVKEGDRVHKGELLIALDDSDVRSKLNAADYGLSVAKGAQKKAMAGANAVQHEAAVVDEKMKPKHHNFVSSFFRSITGAKRKEQVVAMQAKMQLAGQEQQAQSGVMQARGEYAKALVVRKVVSADTSYFRIASPIDGIVETRNVQPGDAVTPGQVLMTIVNLHEVYLRCFVPEGSVGRIGIGQRANVYLDSAPERPLSGHIVSIDSEASFTPENVYFQQDRVKQAFGVKVEIDNPDGLAKPGMPADAEFTLKKQEHSK